MLKQALIAALAVRLVVWSVGSPVPAVDHPPPPRPPAVAAATVTERYQAVGEVVRDAVRRSRAAGDPASAAAFTPFLGRNLLTFDPRGQGRVVEVVGDLAAADRIAVLVPGAHTTVAGFDGPAGPGGGARALLREAEAVDPSVRLVAVAWLGYDAPLGASPASVTDRRARQAAGELRRTVADLRRVNPDAGITLLCHSYGSVVCGYAAPDLPVTDLVLFGSPGVGVDSAAGLRTGARVWAARADRDWIRWVPSVRWAGVGFGADPTTTEFGALRFDAGAGGHSDYLRPGSTALGNVARIALARPEAVSCRG